MLIGTQIVRRYYVFLFFFSNGSLLEYCFCYCNLVILIALRSLYCIVLYCIVLYCIVLYCIVLYYCIVLLYCIVLYFIVLYCIVLHCIVQGVPKKRDILNIYIKSEGINIFLQKFCGTESTIFVVKCQNFTFIVQLFMT